MPSRRSGGSAPAGSWPLRLAALVVAVLCVLPVVIVFRKAFESGFGDAMDLLWRPRVGELLTNTVELVVLTCVLATVLGVGAAWLVERTTLPGRGLAGGAGRAAGRARVRQQLRVGRCCRG